MFSKKHLDVKKSLQKILDVKKDSFSRLKHLRVLLENLDLNETKNFFDTHYSHTYFIFFDVLSSLETPLKQRGQKQAKDELDSALFILEKMLVFLPELVARGWQYHSICTILKKLLHHGNSVRYRQEGMRLFLLWYQILGENDDQDVELMFTSLVPGIVPHSSNVSISKTPSQPLTEAAFYADFSGKETGATDAVTPCEVEPLVPAFSVEPQIQDVTSYYLQSLIHYSVSQISKILWNQDRKQKQLKCFDYIFKKFRIIYLPYIFVDLSDSLLLSAPKFDPPSSVVNYEEEALSDGRRLANKDTLAHCKAVVIRWLAKYLRNEEVEAVPRTESNDSGQQLATSRPAPTFNLVQSSNEQNPTDFGEPSPLEYEIVRTVLSSSDLNVNLVHELFRQAFLMPYSHALTMRKVVAVYKEWIYKSECVVPLLPKKFKTDSKDSREASMSYLLRIFITNAANIFVQYVPAEKPLLLEEQVEMCKRVLNIYRFMVMKLDMTKETWEQLLVVMLRITSLVLSKTLPVKKEDTLGGRLAPAFFQTLIVTWIRANLNVHVSSNLWEQFHLTLSSLTEWEELIREWSKTIDTLTRVMCRYVYGINLHDLPLERPSERRQKKIRGVKKLSSPFKSDNCTTVDGTAPHPVGRQASKSFSSVEESKLRERYENNDSPPSRVHKCSSSLDEDFGAGVSRSASDSHLVAKKWLSRLGEGTTKNYQRNGRVESASAKPEKSRSLECLYQRIDSPCFSESSVGQSRSPSPTPSSGIESNSLKESPLHIEGNVNVGDQEITSRSVISGGSHRGWCAEIAVMLWKRMLGVLGDPNNIRQPILHSQVIETFGKVIEDFVKVRENLGVCIDQTTPSSPPNLIPPLYYFASWLFKCIELPNEYHSGKTLAYKYLCVMMARRHDLEPSTDLLACFYLTLHKGFLSYDLELTSIIIRHCGAKLFSHGLPGSSCLLFDFISASNVILQSPDTKPIPRFEALGLLATLLGMSAIYKDIAALQPSATDVTVTQCKELKEHLLIMLMKSSKNEHTALGRSIALHSLAMFLYSELHNRGNHPRVPEVIEILCSALKFRNRALSRVACDSLRLQADHAAYILSKNPQFPRKIILSLLSSLLEHWEISRSHKEMKEYKTLLLSLTFALGEWCFSVPKSFLSAAQSTDGSERNLLSSVLNGLFAILNDNLVMSDVFPASSHQIPESSINYNITINNLQENGVSPSVSPRKRVMSDSDGRSSLRRPDSGASSDLSVVKFAVQMLIGHLYNFWGHFPLPTLGASKLCSVINEDDDNPYIYKPDEQSELSSELFSSPNVLFFIVNDCTIMSFVDLGDHLRNESKNKSKNKPCSRIIVRDLIGKYAWNSAEINFNYAKSKPFTCKERTQASAALPDPVDDTVSSSERADPLDSLLRYIGHTSPECVHNKKRCPLNVPVPARTPSLAQLEENMIALLLNQHYQEMNYNEERSSFANVVRRNENSSGVQKQNVLLTSELEPAFKHCRQLIDQLGFLSWEKRPKIDLLSKNERILREIRNLDNQTNRETHKIAVIYVAEGQEDKNSILLNGGGSKAFEQFVAGLGWEVNLETHRGFRGGLQQNKSTGLTAPYYANAFLEVIFHVSTRIPASREDEEDFTRKLRHLGNDGVHIVWSEHTRDYRRGIIPTEFCDILVVIYPVPAFPGYYRIHISRKPEVPHFGPLYSGAVVHHSVLAGLVRATAINASRAQRMQLCHDNGFQNYFEERARSIETIVKHHKEQKCFEDFAATVYSPLQLGLLCSRPASSMSTGLTVSSSENSNCFISNSSNDRFQMSKSRNRPVSLSSVEQRLSPRMGIPNNADRPLSALSITQNPPVSSGGH